MGVHVAAASWRRGFAALRVRACVPYALRGFYMRLMPSPGSPPLTYPTIIYYDPGGGLRAYVPRTPFAVCKLAGGDRVGRVYLWAGCAALRQKRAGRGVRAGAELPCAALVAARYRLTNPDGSSPSMAVTGARLMLDLSGDIRFAPQSSVSDL